MVATGGALGCGGVSGSWPLPFPLPLPPPFPGLSAPAFAGGTAGVAGVAGREPGGRAGVAGTAATAPPCFGLCGLCGFVARGGFGEEVTGGLDAGGVAAGGFATGPADPGAGGWVGAVTPPEGVSGPPAGGVVSPPLGSSPGPGFPDGGVSGPAVVGLDGLSTAGGGANPGRKSAEPGDEPVTDGVSCVGCCALGFTTTSSGTARCPEPGTASSRAVRPSRPLNACAQSWTDAKVPAPMTATYAAAESGRLT